ncbi:MAG: DNA-protecting protein DprA [Desulfamplus sp.]|nr:DNA-protecting protein DprA [Desulfamplus sp.]
MQCYLPWFCLRSVPGLGNIMYKRLIKRFGSPEKVLSAHVHDLKQVQGMGKRVIEGIGRSRITGEMIQEIALIHKKGFSIAAFTDEIYPVLLREIPDPPPLFTYLGTLNPHAPVIAIVGSRQATAYGLSTSCSLAHDISLKGFEVISGMALGIDTAAHEGALQARGRTVAVLGSGLGVIYPRENRRLFYKIADNGAVISEFPVHAVPHAGHFPRRNRIIAGMATGTVVVEAAERSGSLITARLAAEYGREVFAVPGNVSSINSAGTHALLKQGAKLVENREDIIDELHHMVHETSTVEKNVKGPGAKLPGRPMVSTEPGDLFTHPLNEPDSPARRHKGTMEMDRNNPSYNEILTMLEESSPVHIDAIIEISQFSAAEVTSALLDLELSGAVKQLPGKMFCRI